MGEWERLAGHEGGTVVALAGAPTASGAAMLYAATAVGLFRSDDAGRTWVAGGDVPLPLLSAVALSARFAQNGLIFAGTRTGFHRSADAGRTWRQTLTGGRAFAVATISGDGGEERVYIGTEEDGILRSDDGGRTWAGANPGLLDLTVLALAFSPDAARDQTGFAATASGLYRTRNGGKSWRAVELPRDEMAVQCVAVSPAFARNRLVFAGTEDAGLWRSDDGGVRWDAVPGLPDGGIGAIAFSPQDANACTVAVATAEGVAISTDGGETWQQTGRELPPVLALAYVPDGDGETLVAGLYRGGVARFVSGQWGAANTGLGATLLTTLVASPSFARDQTLVAAGPEAGVRVSRDGGRTWADAGAGDDVLFAGDAGQTVGGALLPPWSDPTLVAADGGSVAIIALAASPQYDADGTVFAATSDGVYRSCDRGRTFARWSDGITPTPVLALAATVAEGDATDSGALIVFALSVDGTIWRRAGGA